MSQGAKEEETKGGGEGGEKCIEKRGMDSEKEEALIIAIQFLVRE